MTDVDIDGSCDPAFAAVRDVLAEVIAGDTDGGAAFSVVVDGRTVVDLWGGFADARAGHAWERDTRCVWFSCTKAVTAVAALRQAELGRVDLEAPVATWWPEFAAHGKDAVLGRHLLTHEAGLPAFDRPVSPEEAADPDLMAAQLAGQEPEWEPGAAHGYHALTFGWLVGELARRASGRDLPGLVRAELGADLHLGLPAGEVADIARISAARDRPDTPPGDAMAPDDVARDLVAAMQTPGSPILRSTANPAASFNKPVVARAGWPAAGLLSTARALAGFYGRLVAGEILAPSILRAATTEHVRGPDRTLVLESAFGLGFMLPSSNMYLPPAARAAAFGHPGASGALGIGDCERRIGIAFVPNVMRPALHDRRAYRLVDAVYAAV